MKLLTKFSLIALSVYSLGCVTACSDASEPDEAEAVEKVALFKKMAAGEVASSYTMTKFDYYLNDSSTGYTWSEVDLYHYLGFESPLPSKLNVMEGKVWQPYRMFSLAMGPSPLETPWRVYCKKTGRNLQLYLTTSITVDEETNSVDFAGCPCTIDAQTDDAFSLIYEDTYSKADGEKGISRSFVTYTKSGLDLPARELMLCYESEHELITDVIARLREEFGNVINLNEYLFPAVILDNPIVDLDELEKKLLAD